MPDNHQAATVRLHHPLDRIKEPILYHLIMDFGLVPNLLRAKVEHEEGGIIDVEIRGAPAALERGLQWARDAGVTVTELP
jgi:hypothetical protein